MTIHRKMLKKTNNCLHEDLAKSDYKPNIKYKYLIIILYIWLHTRNHILSCT